MGPRGWRSVVMLAGAVLVSTGCAALQQQASNSPDTSPQVSTSPSTAPVESPTPESSPSSAPSPSPKKLVITALPFHIGEVGVTYLTVTFGASGGVKPYKWSINSGSLPPGLAVSSGRSATGKPTTAGTFSFVVRVVDSAGTAAGVARSIFVFRQIAFTKASWTCRGTYQTGCVTKVTYTGGASSAPKVKVTLNAGDPPLPPGSTITAKGGTVTVSIAIPPCSYPHAVATLVLLDQSPCTTGFRCTSGTATVDIALSSGC
jgi:hypothetical protein